jgi:hypothetical protein
VLRNNYLYLPFQDISGKVNERWAQQNIKQKSKVDSVEVGDNWNAFYWPSKRPIIPSMLLLLLSILLHSLQMPQIFPMVVSLELIRILFNKRVTQIEEVNPW